MAETLVTGMESGTSPTVSISSALDSAGATAFSLRFEYMPDSVSFGVTANFQPMPVPYTSARWMIFQGSDINEVSLQVKVAAGCNNAMTFWSGASGASVNEAFNAQGTGFGRVANIAMGNMKATRFERMGLIKLARVLYALPLPVKNQGWNGVSAAAGANDQLGMPPPTCRLTVGKMFSGPGAFTRCDITFNGPWDFDGAPTDMDVNLSFLPSEFYDSSGFIEQSQAPILNPIGTPHGEKQQLVDEPYALYFNNTQTAKLEAINIPAEYREPAPKVPSGSQNNQPAVIRLPTKELQPETAAAERVERETQSMRESPTNEDVAKAWSQYAQPVNPDKVQRLENGNYIIEGMPVDKAEVNRALNQYYSSQQAAAMQDAAGTPPGYGTTPSPPPSPPPPPPPTPSPPSPAPTPAPPTPALTSDIQRSINEELFGSPTLGKGGWSNNTTASDDEFPYSLGRPY